jgi:hypothetical protein
MAPTTVSPAACQELLRTHVMAMLRDGWTLNELLVAMAGLKVEIASAAEYQQAIMEADLRP